MTEERTTMFPSGYTPGSIASFLSAASSPATDGDSEQQQALASLFTKPPVPLAPKQKPKKKRKAEKDLTSDNQGTVDMAEATPSRDGRQFSDSDAESSSTKKKKKKKIGMTEEQQFKPNPEESTRPTLGGNVDKKKPKKKRKAEKDGNQGKVVDTPSKAKDDDSDSDVDSPPLVKKKKMPEVTDEKEEDEEEGEKKKFRPDPEKNKRTIFVGNLPNSIEKKTLVKMFKRFGKVESVRFRSAAPADPKLPRRAVVIKKEFHPERHNINGYVVFADESSCQQALEMNGTNVEGKHIRVDRLNQQKHDHKRSVFIGNLSYKMEEEAVHQFFIDCGEIENVRLIRDRLTSVGKGFGYVLFKRTDSVNLAMKLQGHLLDGRTVRIERSSGTTVVAHNIAKRQGMKEHKGLQKKTKMKVKKKERTQDQDTKKTSKLHKNKEMKIQSSGPDFQGTKAHLKGKRDRKMKHKKKQKGRMERKKKKNVANLLLGAPGIKQPVKQKRSSDGSPKHTHKKKDGDTGKFKNGMAKHGKIEKKKHKLSQK